jgi:anti-sigma factor RsiW
MICSDVKYYAPLYLSGELDAKTLVDIEHHIEECAVCRTLIEEQQSIDRSIREAVLDQPLDASRIRNHVLLQIQQEADRGSGRKRYLFWRSLLAAAALLCILLLGRVRLLNGAFYSAAAKDHIDDVVKVIPKLGWQTDEQSIRAYLAARLGKDGTPERLQLAGYRLLRARDCHLRNQVYAHLIYGDGSQLISLYIRPGTRTGLDRMVSGDYFEPVESRFEQGFDITRAETGGRTLVLVGRIAEPQARTLMGSALRSLM